LSADALLGLCIYVCVLDDVPLIYGIKI
jgi:hypothetical protein